MFLGGDHRDRDSATAYSKTNTNTHVDLRLFSQLPERFFICPSLAGMSVEMVAMLVASIIQGQVVAVYNTEKQEACQHLDHEAPQGTSSPQNASLQETVDTALKM